MGIIHRSVILRGAFYGASAVEIGNRGSNLRGKHFIGASALALTAVLGPDSGLQTAQSFTIPTVCTDAAACASLCRSVGEEGRTESDFIALAAYQLGPEKPIALPPANLSMPAPVDPKNVYAGTGAGMFSPAVAGALSRVYSPNLISGKVDVIDPETFTVIESLAAIPSPQHIVPSWDLQTLWVSGDISYRGGHADVMPIDPKTGKLGKAIDVPDSYNMYFTPDGKSAILVAESMRRLEFRDPHTMALQGYIATPKCSGVNHADFAADGSYAIFTCEYDNSLAKMDLVHHRLEGILPLSPGGMPQDIRISPDGSVFFVADLLKDGVVLVAGDSFQQIGFIHTGVGAHGLYPSRDGTKLYVSNRGTHDIAGVRKGQGSVTVLDFMTGKVLANWVVPGGGSPDMGNVSADGKWLWLSGRYDGVIYAFNTADGSVKTIPVGGMPHGLTVWPQPGRYSLGHTGNLR
ncbi:MAG TPA: YncE family protein [Roseiarcus sp.]|nr:YncE family protein [Roseiarcus sp.]